MRNENLPLEVAPGLTITTAEAHTIQAIGEAGQLRVLDLATQFGITKSAASQTVAKLLKKGFIARSASPHSGKEFFLSLTEQGWQAFRAHEKVHGQDFERMLERLSAFSVAQLATVTVMLETIGEIVDERLAGQE